MKALFYALVFANLAFLGWVLLIGEPARDSTVPAARSASIPPLKLAVESATPTSVGAAPATGKRCVTVGPFLEPIQVDRAAQLLRTEHLTPRQRSAEQPAGVAFVVGLTAPTPADATRTAMRLRTAGIKDVTTRASGPEAARLTFGSYATHAEAEARVTALRKFGVDPTITDEARTVLTFWLDIDLGAGDRPVDVAAIQATVGGSRGSLVLQSCEPPAGAPPATPAGPPAVPKAA